MKEIIHKSIAVCMAFVVLMTTMSFTIDMHYCGDTMVDFAFFKDAKSCKMEKVQLASNSENPNISQKPCCSDKKIVVEGQEDLKNAVDRITFEQQTFVSVLFHSYISLFESYDKNIIPYKEYRPPFVKQNLLVLHQTFLI